LGVDRRFGVRRRDPTLIEAPQELTAMADPAVAAALLYGQTACGRAAAFSGTAVG
jgi:hypothetical protein